jgi:hypothetical protein
VQESSAKQQNDRANAGRGGSRQASKQAQKLIIGEVERHHHLIGCVLLELLLQAVGVIEHGRQTAMMAREAPHGSAIVLTLRWILPLRSSTRRGPSV